VKLTLIFFVLLFISYNAFPQGSAGLVAHWNFNGNANDVSGNNLNGVVTGAALTTGYNGIANTAYKFNGTSDRIDIAYNSLLNLDSFSICALVKPMGYYSGACQGNFIVTRGEWVSTPSDFYYLSFDDNAWDNSCATFSNGHEVFDVNCHASSAPPSSAWYTSLDTITLDSWYCITTTYTQNTVKLYIGGILRRALSFPDNYVASNDPLGIGYNPPGVSTGYPCWFNGAIDDIRIYNRALADSEVTKYCDSAEMLVVVINPTDSIISVSVDPLCAGSTFTVTYGTSASFNAGNVFTVQLSDASGSFASPVNIGSIPNTVSGTISCTIPSGTLPGTGYKIRIVSTNPVYTSDSANIIVSTGSLTAPIISSNSPICAGSNLVLTTSSPTSGVSYSWSGPNSFSSASQNPVISNATTADAGTYTLSVSADGCTNSASLNVVVYPNVSPGFSISGNPCISGKVSVTANTSSLNASDYHWNFGSATIHSGSAAGPYTLSWNDAGSYTISLSLTGNCQPADTQNIIIYPSPSDHIIASKTNVCSGDTVLLHPLADSANYTYRWASLTGTISDTNTALTFVRPESSGNIYMHIYNQYGCMGADSVYINATPCCNLYVPNAFTPNGDGVNDLFRTHSIRTFESYQCIIMNRWGQEVFSSKDQDAGWDGFFNGVKQDVDVYFYYIKYSCNSKEYTKKGDMTLLR